MGGSTLDGLAADNAALVEYCLGDGGQRLARLMADALQGGRDVPQGVPAEDLLQAVIAAPASAGSGASGGTRSSRADLTSNHH
ncbi:hypothetical protein [Nonomuraea sp. NPDC049784]|uniref:hypothetical protein n=1 Tax=Nonomuraea sp. NPDC049784 TaxID=3154361 RepID=UPI0033EAF979